MRFTNLHNVKKNRLYRTDKLIVNQTKSPLGGKGIVVLNPTVSVPTFVESYHKLVLTPNQTKKVFFPPYKLNFPKLTKIASTTDRDSSFRELGKLDDSFNKILDFAKIPTDYLKKPIVIDLSIYRDELNKWAMKRRITPKTISMIRSQLLLTLRALKEQIPDVLDKPMVIIKFDKEFDPFASVLIQQISSGAKDLYSIMSGIRTLFYTDNGFLLYTEFADSKESGDLKRYLRSLLAIASAANEEDIRSITNNEYDIGKDADNIEVDSEAERNKLKDVVTKTAKVETDSSDKEQAELVPDMVFDKQPEDGTVIEDPEPTPKEPQEDSQESDTKPDETDDLGDLADIGNTIAQFGATELEQQRLAEERKVFLDKHLATQEAALAELEKVADELSKDKTIEAPPVLEPTILSEKLKKPLITGLATSYYKKQFKRDLLDCIKTVNDDPEFPCVVTKFEIKNNSNPLAKLDELSIEFLDKHGKKHPFVVDVPKLSHDGFLYFNGGKKFIAKQALAIPVIKETHDRVQVTTNYRKSFLYRKGEKTSGQSDRVLRVLVNGDYPSVTKVLGNGFVSNMEYDVSLPYNYLSKRLISAEFKNGDASTTYHFNQKLLRELMEEHGEKIPNENLIPVAYTSHKGKIQEFLYEKVDGREIVKLVEKGKNLLKIAPNLTSMITNSVSKSSDEELVAAYLKTKPSNSLSHTDVKIAGSSVALGVLIASYKGLLNALDAYNVKYHVEEKRIAKKESEIMLPFKDAYLFIDAEYDPSKEIFVNGLLALQTSLYSLQETQMFAPVYLDYYEMVTGSRNTAKALDNFKNSMIDPITKSTLRSYGLPETFPELLLYANTLLGSLERNRKNDMDHFRIRDAEVITVAVFNTLMDSFNNYKRSKRTGVVKPISAKRNSVITAIQDMTNVEDFSILSPFLEAELKSKTTFKGPSGLTLVHYKLP